LCEAPILDQDRRHAEPRRSASVHLDARADGRGCRHRVHQACKTDHQGDYRAAPPRRSLPIRSASSPLYDWIKDYLLPTSLVLLILALDVPGIVRLGPKALIMMLAVAGYVRGTYAGLVCMVMLKYVAGA